MAVDAAQRLMGKFIDADSLDPLAEEGGCVVEFFMEAEEDQLLTEGGIIEKKHPKVKEIRKLEQDALSLLRQENPFNEEEPKQPPKDAQPNVLRAYTDAYKEWDERRQAHDADLKEKATLLRDHHEIKDVYVVSPAGRPMYVDREFIRKIIPGDQGNVVVHHPTRAEIDAYRAQYERFKAGMAQVTTGTPLDKLPGVSRAQVKELAYFNIRTVEQLAKVSDGNLQNIGPYMALRRKAQDWLATARGAAPIEEARAESARLKEELALLKRQMSELIEQQQNQRGPQQNHQQGQNQQRR